MTTTVAGVTIEEMRSQFAHGLVPHVVRPSWTIRSEIHPFDGPIADIGKLYPAHWNQHGAVSAITDSGILGLKPGEFEAVKWGRKDRPVRIQRKRSKGWRMPTGCVSVTRPGPFGNPFVMKSLIEAGYSQNDEEKDRAYLVECFREWLRGKGSCYMWAGPTAKAAYERLSSRIGELRGKRLACFCALDKACHADVLLEVANA